MKLPRIVLPVFLVLGVALAVPARGPVRLVRIEKGAPGLESLFRIGGLDIVQELKTCYVGRLDREEVSFLEYAGVAVKPLDRHPAGKTYYIIRADSDATLTVLSGRGKVAVLETGSLLFWTPSGDGAGAIPANLARKPLATSSIVRYLRKYPAPAVATSAVARDPIIGTIVDSVSRENLRALVKVLQDFGTRRTHTPGCDAAEAFIFNYFGGQGLRAFDTYNATHGARAVVGELKGTNFPDDIVIVCAHMDSTSPEPDTLAPGADDNASGTAAVMEAARILARYTMDYTVRFIAFNGEEQGLYGSQAYATAAYGSKERIVGVVNLDMIAYADRMPEDLDVFVNSASEWMGHRIALDAAEYAGLSVKAQVDPSMVYSDHASFWDYGYAALLAIDDVPLQNPFYHTIGDTVDTLNLDFCAQATKAALATAAFLAQPARTEPPPPQVLEAQSSFFSALLGTRKNVYLRWERAAEGSRVNVYRTEIPHGFYQKMNDLPIDGTTFADKGVPTGVTYYYAITAVDQAGTESNLSREIEVLPLPPRRTSL
jgi:hypothetical protein